jgi:hypothetical protein
VHADTEVCFELFKVADFGFVHQVLTFTRVRPESLYARSLAMETPMAAILRLLVTYAPSYLTPEELERAVDRHLDQYYRLLGKNLLLLRRDRQFWDFHKAALRDSGSGYSRARVARGTLAFLAHALFRRVSVAKSKAQ